MGRKEPVYVTIMAGGGGTRFWPWSRGKSPKQILPILSDRPMIWETVERVRPFVPSEQIMIVTASLQAKELHRQVPQIPPANILIEPKGKNTAPCLCLAALYIQKRDPEAIMAVLPADHFIADRKLFLQTLEGAAEFAARQNFLVTLGIEPTEPETGYGYIQKGEKLGRAAGMKVFRARAFREKPTRARARWYLRRGDYLWNSGMFVWKVGVFLEALERFLPSLYREMLKLRAFWGTRREKVALRNIYERIQPVSVDYGIMEKAHNVALMPAKFPWNDVGSWAALAQIWPRDKAGNVFPGGKRAGAGKVLMIDSSGCLVRAEEKLIATIGLKDMVVVESGNAFLVCPRARSQEVRRILQALNERGWSEYL
jgi:mannose-1-phosphate guanylyltransferase